MRAFIALVVIVILFTVGGQLKGFWKWLRGLVKDFWKWVRELDPMTVGAILGAPILIIGTIAYKSVTSYLNQTPWERCISSKDTYVQMADYECRIELGMEPIEKPVFSRKKKVTLSPEREAELKAILFGQKKVTPEREAEPTSQDARQDDDSE